MKEHFEYFSNFVLAVVRYTGLNVLDHYLFHDSNRRDPKLI
jgi:hypothetical protein